MFTVLATLHCTQNPSLRTTSVAMGHLSSVSRIQTFVAMSLIAPGCSARAAPAENSFLSLGLCVPMHKPLISRLMHKRHSTRGLL